MLAANWRELEMRALIPLLACLGLALSVDAARAADAKLVPLDELDRTESRSDLGHYARRCAALSRMLYEVSARKKTRDLKLHENLGRMAHSFSIMAFNLSFREAEQEEGETLVDYAAISADISKIALAYLEKMKLEQAAGGKGGDGIVTKDASRCARIHQVYTRNREQALDGDGQANPGTE